MSKNHAVIVQKPGEVQVQEASIPRLRDDYILVKTKAVALNPTDWKHVDFLTSKGARLSLLVQALCCSQLTRYSFQLADWKNGLAAITAASLRRSEAKSLSYLKKKVIEYAAFVMEETK